MAIGKARLFREVTSSAATWRILCARVANYGVRPLRRRARSGASLDAIYQMSSVSMPK